MDAFGSSLPRTESSISRPRIARLDHDFLREFAGEIHRGGEFLRVVRLGHADRTSERRGLHENGEAEFLADLAQNFRARFFPLRARNRQEIAHGQLGLQEQSLLHVLVHAHGGAQHARADVGKPGKIEQALHRAVLAKRAVQHGKNHVHAQRIRPRIARGNERRHIRIGGQHHALARAQHFAERRGQHFVRRGSGEPAAVLRDADGHRFVFFGIERGITDAAEISETSCSPERPPNKTPMRSRFFSVVMIDLVRCSAASCRQLCL